MLNCHKTQKNRECVMKKKQKQLTVWFETMTAAVKKQMTHFIHALFYSAHFRGQTVAIFGLNLIYSFSNH